MTGNTGPSKIDISALPCLDQCKQLYNAYMRMLMGGQKTTVRHGDFWVEYRANSAADLEKLATLYETMRSQCTEAMSELPSLRASRRGFTMGRSEYWPGGMNKPTRYR